LYIASRPASYHAGFLSMFPARMRARLTEVRGESARALRGWFVSQVLAMLIVGVIASVGLKVIGSDYWFQLGSLTATLELVPFIGPAAAFFAAVLVTLASQPDKIWWVGGYFLLLLRLEGDLIIPLLMRGRIELPPVHLLTLMLVMGEGFGVLGFLVAAPLLAVLRKIYLMTYVPRMDVQSDAAVAEPGTLRKSA
ncbi:MAG: AI-2E family transporter, partial [Bdellovibrionota bacterium]